MKGIAIFGCMGAGKDALGAMIAQEIQSPTQARIFKLGEDIRGIVDAALPDQNNRKIYQEYGQIVRNTIHTDAWNNICNGKIEKASAMYKSFLPIITDGRQVNECQYWREKGFYIIGIQATEDQRYIRMLERDGSCDRLRMYHDTEYQAQYVASQIADMLVLNTLNLDYLNDVAREIACKIGRPL